MLYCINASQTKGNPCLCAAREARGREERQWIEKRKARERLDTIRKMDHFLFASASPAADPRVGPGSTIYLPQSGMIMRGNSCPASRVPRSNSLGRNMQPPTQFTLHEGTPKTQKISFYSNEAKSRKNESVAGARPLVVSYEAVRIFFVVRGTTSAFACSTFPILGLGTKAQRQPAHSELVQTPISKRVAGKPRSPAPPGW